MYSLTHYFEELPLFKAPDGIKAALWCDGKAAIDFGPDGNWTVGAIDLETCGFHEKVLHQAYVEVEGPLHAVIVQALVSACRDTIDETVEAFLIEQGVKRVRDDRREHGLSIVQLLGRTH